MTDASLPLSEATDTVWMETEAFDELDAILDDLRSRYDETPQWEFCEGFMAAVICSRRLISVDEYLAVLLGLPTEAQAGEAPDDFDAAHWFARWMADPVPALGGLAPQELLDTADGREAISTLLYQMKSGVYA